MKAPYIVPKGLNLGEVNFMHSGCSRPHTGDAPRRSSTQAQGSWVIESIPANDAPNGDCFKVLAQVAASQTDRGSAQVLLGVHSSAYGGKLLHCFPWDSRSTSRHSTLSRDKFHPSPPQMVFHKTVELVSSGMIPVCYVYGRGYVLRTTYYVLAVHKLLRYVSRLTRAFAR